MAEFVSKASLSKSMRKYYEKRGEFEGDYAENTGRAPKVYRNVSESSPSLSHNEVQKISREANRRTGQGMNADNPDFRRRAARKAIKMGAKAEAALKGGEGVTEKTVGALRRAVIGMGKFGAKVAKATEGASGALPSELVEEGGKMVDRGMKKVVARRAENAAKRRRRVAAVRATG